MISGEEFKRLRGRFSRLQSVRDQYWRLQWKSIAKFISPHHGRFLEDGEQPSRGGDKTAHIYNNTAGYAASIAVSGFKGGLVPQSMPWFWPSLTDADLANWGPSKIWLSQTHDRMMAALDRTNFYTAAHSIFHDLIHFGTGVLFVGDHPEKLMNFKPWTIGEFVLATNEFGEVDTAFRWYWQTARALAAEFGKDRLSPSTQNLLDKNPDEHVKCVHAIYPRKDHDPGKLDNRNMPWAALYWEDGAPEGTEPLRESGYRTKPFMAPRWDVVGEDAYGSNCPGMNAIGDVKMLQKMEADHLLAVDKATNPPMAWNAKNGRLSLLPNAINRMDDVEQLKPVYSVQPNTQHIAVKIQQVEERIKQTFFFDMFLMLLQDKRMTATEVAQRHEDKLAILGPVLEKIFPELLHAALDRQFDMMLRAGALPPPPKELQGQELKFEFRSKLAQAQRMVNIQPIEQTATFAASLATVNPEVLDKVNFDKMLDKYGDLRGVPPEVIRSDEEVAEIRQGRAQAQQQQQALEAIPRGAQAAKTLSETMMGQGSALDQVMGGAL